MSSNIYKSNQIIVQNDDALMIDNNEKIAKKIAHIESLMLSEAKNESENDMPGGFTLGVDAEQVDALLADEEDMLKGPAAEGEGNQESFQVTSAQVQEMLEQARSDAEEIKSEVMAGAQQELEQLRQSAWDEGHAQGYNAGYNEGKAKVEMQRKNLEEERLRLEQEYRDLVKELEPKFIESLTDIYEQIFKVDLSKEQDIILHLISNSMHKIEGSNNYLIHVSREDYPYVNMKKEELLTAGISPNASVEVVEDITLGVNECMIETDGGVFDCGLGTQLEELSQKLRLLSYTRG